MNPSEIAPTKTNLFDYKGQLSFSVDGHSLLEEKREVLVLHLMDIITQIKEQRVRLNKLLKESFALLKQVKLEIGEYELEKVAQTSKPSPEVDIHEKSVMGVNIPSIKYHEPLEGSKPALSFNSTSSSFDVLVNRAREMTLLLVQVAQVEAAAWRLAYEIKKTQRRVNALENVFIPEFKSIIKFIQETLEERERETFFQMKKIKNAHESSKK